MEKETEKEVEVLDSTEEQPKEQPKEHPKEQPPKKNKKKKIIIGVISIIILIIVVAVVVILLPKEKKTNVSTDVEVKESEYKLSGNSLEDFDLRFIQLENQNTNMVYSPLSIKYALAMLKEGTKGDSKQQITNIIGDYKSKKYVNSNNMSFANAMFIRNTYKDSINSDYTNNLKEKYDAEVIYDSFETPDNLNKWVSDKTFNLINNLYDDVSDLDYSLVNALAIDMNWNNLIQAEDGRTVPFKAYSVHYAHEDYSDFVPMLAHNQYNSMMFNGNTNIKSVQVGASLNNYDIVTELGVDKIKETVLNEYDKFVANKVCGDDYDYSPLTESYLNQYIQDLDSNYKRVDESTDFLLYDDEEVKSFAKDLQTYNGTTLQYVGIMPKNDDLNKYIENISAEKVNNIIDNLKEIKLENFKQGVVTKVKASIPLFKFEYELKLKEDLKKMGITNVFDEDKADLSGLTNTKSYIDSATHKANIEFSNEGIKAAAATQMGGYGSTTGCGFDYKFEVPVEEIDLTFDKPYMFVIRDKSTGEVWFTGTVYEPSTN